MCGHPNGGLTAPSLIRMTSPEWSRHAHLAIEDLELGLASSQQENSHGSVLHTPGRTTIAAPVKHRICAVQAFNPKMVVVAPFRKGRLVCVRAQ